MINIIIIQPIDATSSLNNGTIFLSTDLLNKSVNLKYFNISFGELRVCDNNEKLIYNDSFYYNEYISKECNDSEFPIDMFKTDIEFAVEEIFSKNIVEYDSFFIYKRYHYEADLYYENKLINNFAPSYKDDYNVFKNIYIFDKVKILK